MDFEIPTIWLLGGGWLTSLTALYWGLYSGYLGTGREIKEKNETIETQRQTIAELMAQNRDFIHGSFAVTNVLEGVRKIAEEGVAKGAEA